MKKNRREGKKTGVSTPKLETENLRYVRRASRAREERSPTPDSSEEDNLRTWPSDWPPRPDYADDGWYCYKVGTKRKDAKEPRRSKNGGVIVDEDDYEIEYVWKKREVVPSNAFKKREVVPSNAFKKREVVPSNAFKIRTKKLSKAAIAMRHKRLQIKTFAGTPPGYYPLKGLNKDAQLAGLVRKCASLALADYNGQALTDYRFVDIKTVSFQLTAGKMYCIVFRARANGQDDTFKACVLKRLVGRLEKRDVYAISVHAVVMMTPESIERNGTLQELI